MATRKTASTPSRKRAPAAAKRRNAAAPARAAKAAPEAAALSKPANAAAPAARKNAAADKPKHKLVRDSFTIPKAEYQALADLKQRAAKLERPAKKSELLRAGIRALIALGDKALMAALARVPSLKTGRPKREDAPKA